MAVIKQTCLLLLLGVWAGVLLGSCYVNSQMTGGWTEQDPQRSSTYLKLAHYAVSTQTKGRTVYDTVVKLTNAATQVVAGINYKLTFVTAPSICKIRHVAYSAEKCLPAGPANKKCTAIIYIAAAANAKQVSSYTCFSLTGKEFIEGFSKVITSENVVVYNEVPERTFADLYRDNKTGIIAETGTTAAVSISAGIRQGCPLSGLSFNLVLDPVIRAVQGGEKQHNVFAYADLA
ncbi:salivary cystatin-L [Rhipicephalus sanguineus]|uniref:salivary cystatin-L n=1 Tax=Rhipicephalus sanguineus TaxID=34632 RepID=UPI00189358C6|nr:salivary cystatin-L [Rhipicephalus sanguineus]